MYKKNNLITIVLGFTAVLSLAACDTMNSSDNVSNTRAEYPQSNNVNGVYSGLGVVKNIEVIRQQVTDSGMGLGTIAGALVGGIVGNQVGGGTGNTVATVAGVAGGAYAGHQLEKRNTQEVDSYRFTIRMDNGNYQTLMLNTNPDLRVGDRVQIDNGVVRRY